MITFTLGDMRRLEADLSAPAGTLTIQPAPTITITSNHDQSTALPATNCTGYDTVAASTVRAWHLIDTSGMTAGSYCAVFTIATLDQTGRPSTYVVDAELIVRSPCA